MVQQNREASRRSSVALVRRLVDEQRWPDALKVALDVWRQTRSSVVADVVEWIDARCLPPEHLPGPKAVANFTDAWLDVARGQPDPVTVSWLGAQIRARLNRGERCRCLFRRLTALRLVGPDPRLGSHLMQLLERQRRDLPVRALFTTMKATQDPRLATRLSHYFEAPLDYDSGTLADLLEGVPGVIRYLSELQIEEPADIEQWRAILPKAYSPSRTDKQTENALLNLVYESPDDIDRRRVYADFLLEHDEPRGTFITLQLQMEAMVQRGEIVPRSLLKQLEALQRRHRRQWLGNPLFGALINVAFAGGFLERAGLTNESRIEPRVWQMALKDPRLATLRTLEKGRGSNDRYVDFVLAPAAKRLREVHVHGQSPVVERLVSGTAPERRIETLVYYITIPNAHDRLVAEHPNFAGLRCLGLGRSVLPNLGNLQQQPTWFDRIEAVNLVNGAGHMVDLRVATGRWPTLPSSVRIFRSMIGLRYPWLTFIRNDNGVDVDWDTTLDQSVEPAEVVNLMPSQTRLLRVRLSLGQDDLRQRIERTSRSFPIEFCGAYGHGGPPHVG